MATWAERIENGDPVQLHYERFEVWHDFIDATLTAPFYNGQMLTYRHPL